MVPIYFSPYFFISYIILSWQKDYSTQTTPKNKGQVSNVVYWIIMSISENIKGQILCYSQQL